MNTSKKVAFLGLEEFLSIPEDLLEKEDDSDLPGKNASNNSGLPTKELSQYETGLQTTNKDGPVTIKPTIQELGEVKEDENVDVTDEEEENVTVGDDNEGGGGNEPGTDDGSVRTTGMQTDEPRDTRVLVKVKLKVAAQKEQNIFYHNLVVSSDKDIVNAELELLVSGDNDKDDGIAITSTDSGQVERNRLTGLVLVAGKNQIKIRFEDNLKHSIKIKAYEIQ